MNMRPVGDDAPRGLLPIARLQQLGSQLRSHLAAKKLWTMLDHVRTTARDAAQERLPEVTALGRRLAERILADPLSSRHPVINATGVLLPDWLELPLPLPAVEKMARQASVMTTAQSSAGDAPRDRAAVRHLLSRSIGAESALIFHNDAAALTAVIAALAGQGDVLVARSQVGCIDRQGPVLLTDVVVAAAARLREVGSVEQARAEDYQQAIESTACVLLRISPADYRILGATCEPTLDELVAVGRKAGVPVVDYLPAALLAELPASGWSAPLVSHSLSAGADLVIFNAQRYLGGPACGIVVGRREFIDRIAAQPLARILQADRHSLAALEATLLLARDPAAAEQAIPLWQMLTASADALRHRAQRLAPQISHCAAVARTDVTDGVTHLGPGKLPGQQLRDWLIVIDPTGGAADALAELLRGGTPSVWADVEQGKVVVHLRSILAKDDEQLAAAFARLGTRSSGAAVAAKPAGEAPNADAADAPPADADASGSPVT